MLRVGAAATVTALAIVPAAPAATVTAVPIVTDAAFPAAFDVARSGKIFYGERLTGRIRAFSQRTSSNRLFFALPRVSSTGGRGLLGLAVHPRYPRVPYVYVHVTRSVGSTVENQVVRIRASRGRGVAVRVLFRASTDATFHNGGPLLFGPDDALYLSLGDAGLPAAAQDAKNPHGKILRLTGAGAVSVASGIRNSFGFAFDPWGGRLWATDNGPECNDELNRIEPGANYGWGARATCASPPSAPANTNQDGPSPRFPQRFDPSPIAPTGVVFCRHCGLGAAREGNLFYGTFLTGEVREVTLGPRRLAARSQRIAYTHLEGILALAAGPRGRLYFSDSTGIYKLAAG